MRATIHFRVFDSFDYCRVPRLWGIILSTRGK